MKFSKLPQEPVYFVVIKSEEPSVLMAKDGNGQIRSAAKYELIEDHGVTPETEVQEVLPK